MKKSVILIAIAVISVAIVVVVFTLTSPTGQKPIPHKRLLSPVNLSNSSAASDSPVISASNSNLYVAWIESTWNSSGVYFRKSSDDGINFSRPIVLSASYSSQINGLQISQDGNNVYVAWYEVQSQFNSTIVLARSSDNGNTFARTVVTGSANSFSGPLKLASADNAVYVVWAGEDPERDQETSANSVFFARSVDRGGSFDKAKPLQVNAGPSVFRDVVARGNDVYVMWHTAMGPDRKHAIFFDRSTDKGETFGDRVRLDHNESLTLQEATDGNLALSGNYVYAIWNFGSDPINLAQYVISSDGGNKFGSPETIDPSAGRIFNPSISAVGDDVYIKWNTESLDGVSNEGDVFLMHSADNGKSFEEPKNVSKDSITDSYPELAISGSRIAVLWLGWDSNGTTTDTFLTTSSNGGLAFSPPVNVSSEQGHGASDAKVAADSQDFYVTWSDISGGNREILLKVYDENTM